MSLVTKSDKIIEKLSTTKHLHSVTFLVAFLEATISPVLPEAFLLVVLAYRKNVSWKVLSLISAFGSACGALLMYVLGAKLYNSYGDKFLSFLHGDGLAEKARELFAENAFMAQFMAALTPLPDRVFSFLAGAFLISPIIIFFATFLGRLIRVAPVAYLSFEYGDEARAYVKKHTRILFIGILSLFLCYVVYLYYS